MVSQMETKYQFEEDEPFVIPGLTDWLGLGEVKKVEVRYEGYRYELVLDGKYVFLLFWDYGNDRVLSRHLDEYFDFWSLYSMCTDSYGEFDAFLIYNEEEFKVVLFERKTGMPMVANVKWRCPKKIYEEWLKNIYWKRPFYITFDAEDLVDFWDRYKSIEELKPVLVLRTLDGPEYILYGDRVVKAETIWKAEEK